MIEKTRSVVLREPERVEVISSEIPSIGESQVLLRVELTGVCSSDAKAYQGNYHRDKIPMIMGHEILGRIAEMGEQASSEMDVSEGDRVVVEAQRPCGRCSDCLAGQYQFCDHNSTYGYTSIENPPGLWGGHSEYMILQPGSVVHPIEESVPAAVGVLACAVVGNSLRWLQAGGDDPIGRSIVIQGPGPQGLSMAAIAKKAGLSPVVVTGLPEDHERLQMAEDLGADHTVEQPPGSIVSATKDVLDGEADIVVNVTGIGATAQDSIDLVDTGGTIVYPSVSGGQVSEVSFDDLVTKDATIRGVFSRTAEHVETAITILEDDPELLSGLVSHSYPLSEAETAYRVAGGLVPEESPLKVVIDPSA
jgi:alcohol dehydrogenase